MNRRELFREYIKKLSTTADPKSALDGGFFVPWPGTPLAAEMAERFSVNPEAAHLLYGPIGTGKTTQLLKTQEFLNQQPNTKAIYIDAGKIAESSIPEKNSLLSIAEDFLVDELPSGISVYTEVIETADRIGFFRDHLPEDVVLLVDSLERVTKSLAALEDDLSELKSLGLGIIISGSYHFLNKVNAPFIARFDQQFVQYLPNPNDPGDRTFLAQVLQRRTDQTILPDEAIQELVTYSGGVLRDLIALARAAGEEAYLQGANQISPGHVKTAALRFGHALMMSFDQQDLNKLNIIKNMGTLHFSHARDEYFSLLSARCILEYQGPSYKVHPTILPHLEKIAA